MLDSYDSDQLRNQIIIVSQRDIRSEFNVVPERVIF
jgi:hypothetical protein